MNRGIVEFFNPSRNFGFIKMPGNKEFFFHGSHYVGVPQLGALVEFEVTAPIKLGKSPMAIKVTPVASQSMEPSVEPVSTGPEVSGE